MRVSFTGHRPEKIDGWSAHPERVEREIRAALADHILRVAREGATTFLSGMAPGVDLWAADEVLRLRAEGLLGGEVRLIAAVPYPNFCKSFAPQERGLYDSVVARADEVVYLCDRYRHGCFAERNNYLVDNAETLIAYYEGSKGGTQYTLRRAIAKGLRVANIHSPGLFDGELVDNV
ncbi:MAG: DUF1273 family protein [Tidjanibacter sp.]|nr:DUF1273 family protein [Tidjanibacter sp.]